MKRKKNLSLEETNYLSFWRAGRKYLLQTNDPGTVRRIRRWNFARAIVRGFNCYLYIFSIPPENQVRARKMLGIPRNGNVLRMPVRPESGS